MGFFCSSYNFSWEIVAACRNLEKGNLVNWDTARFEKLNLDEYDVSMESVCFPVTTNSIPKKESYFLNC